MCLKKMYDEQYNELLDYILKSENDDVSEKQIDNTGLKWIKYY